MKTLSDKRGYFPRTHQVIYLEEDVKQFIKEDILDYFKGNHIINDKGEKVITIEMLERRLKERAGNKLI